MKKKFCFILVIISISMLTSGCNGYITAKTDKNDIYYGVFNRRDMIHADVKIYKKNSPVTCDGVIFLDSPSRAFTLKNDVVNAKMRLSCSDKKLIDADLKMTKGSFDKPYGSGVDQFNNSYNFSTITKSVFQNNIKTTKIELINDKNSYSLKY